MAGDWSKAEHNLRDKPEVIAISELLKLPELVGPQHAQDLVAYKCLRVWEWFDKHSTDGNAPGVTPTFLDRHVALDGFSSALESVGWLLIRKSGISMPKFERHCSKSAKERALTNARVKRSRNVSTVTPPLPEKRREEKNNKKRTPFIPPSFEEVRSYCAERKNQIDPEQFLAHYAANGWKQGSGKPIVDWRSAVITWEKNARNKRFGGHQSALVDLVK